MSNKQVVGRALWERCSLCGSLTNQKAKKTKPCLSKDECKAVIICGNQTTQIKEAGSHLAPSDFVEFMRKLKKL